MRGNPHTIKHIFSGISLVAFLWVLFKLYTFDEWDHFSLHLSSHSSYIPSLLVFQFFLLIINLSLETRKWQLLARPVLKISFRHSMSQVIKGIQLGLFTPSRAGEPIGRSMFFIPSERPKIIILSLTGSIIQNTVILSTTLWALVWTEQYGNEYLHLLTNYYSNIKIIWLILGISGFTILSILGLRYFLLTRPFFLFLKTHFGILHKTGYKLFLNITFLTVIRYFVFCLQFFLLLHFFGLPASQDTFFSVFLFYGAITFLPSAGAADLAIRSSVALLVFGHTAITGPGVVMASMLLWLFNLGLPALLPSIKKAGQFSIGLIPGKNNISI